MCILRLILCFVKKSRKSCTKETFNTSICIGQKQIYSVVYCLSKMYRNGRICWVFRLFPIIIEVKYSYAFIELWRELAKDNHKKLKSHESWTDQRIKTLCDLLVWVYLFSTHIYNINNSSTVSCIYISYSPYTDLWEGWNSFVLPISCNLCYSNSFKKLVWMLTLKKQ